MAKVFLGISIVLLICAAGLGFVTKGKVEQKVAELGATKQKLSDTDHKLTVTTGELKKTTETLTAANKTIDDQKGQLTEMEGKVAAAKADAEKATAAVAEKETLLADLQKKLDDAMKPPVPGTQTENPAMIALQKEVDDAKKALAEANVMKEQFQQRQTVAETKLVDAQKRIEHYEKPIANAGLTASVVAVNQGWNFVVVNVGDKQGVTVNSPLLVMRGGQRVANLKITSVEPRTSIADVVPGSMARGTVVQPGDRVVFAGVRGQGPTAPLPPAGATSGADAVPPAVTGVQ